MKVTRKGYYTITKQGVLLTKPDGSPLQVTSRDECYERCTENGPGTYQIHCPDREVEVGLIARSDSVQPPNIPPEWTGTPVLSVIEGVGGTVDLNDYVFDAEGDVLTFVKTAGTWPNNTTLDSGGVITITSACTIETQATITVTADDGTASPVASSAFSVVIRAVGTTKKWNPGHYMQIYLGDSNPAEQSKRFGYYDAITNETAVEGVGIYVKWAEVESTQGVYTLTWLRTELNYLKNLNVPKRLWLSMVPHSYGGVPGDHGLTTEYYPQYVLDNAWAQEISNGSCMSYWKTDAVNAWLGVLSAIADEFDNDDYFEGIFPIRETAVGNTDPAGITNALLRQGFVDVATAAAGYFTRSNVVMNVNYLRSNQAAANSLIAELVTLNPPVGIGGPDTLDVDDYATYGTLCLIGLSGGVDYRPQTAGGQGKCPICFRAEGLATYLLPNRNPGYSAAEMFSIFDTQHRGSHLMWGRIQTGNGGALPNQDWEDGVLPYIQQNPQWTHLAQPVNYD